MTAIELENRIKNGNIDSIYLFYGEEKYILETNVKRIKKAFGDLILGINYIQINETNVSSLISDMETPAFGYEKKLIIIKDSGLFKKEKKGAGKDVYLQKEIAEYIENNIEIINQSLILIFIEDEITKNDLVKTIEKHGIVCEFEILKPIELKKRLKAICNAYKVNVDERTLQIFIETCGTNMQVLINEIRKLIEYAGENGTITEETIELLSIKEFDSVIFDLTDNLGRRNTKDALQILKELIYNKEPIQKILITLYNHFKKLYLTRISNKI